MKKISKKLPAIPEIPNEIIEAIDKGDLYIFVGAGLSKLFGYPLWSEFADNLVNECVKNGVISLSEKATLINCNFTPMQLVTISYNELTNKLGDKKARRIFRKYFSSNVIKDNRKTVEEVCEYLNNYCCPILTTNADLSLDESSYFRNQLIVNDFTKRIDESKKTYASIIHLHGSIKDFDSLVFTSNQYAKAYMIDSDFGKNLDKIFSKDKTVLFIGYGLSEFELIRYFLKANDSPNNNMFILLGYLDMEKRKYSFDKVYYQSLGIEVLYYSREEKDYNAIIDVLREWNKVVTTRTLAHMSIPKKIREAFSSAPNKSSKKYVKSYLNEKNEEIIKAMSKTEYFNEWMLFLIKANMFSVDYIGDCLKSKERKNWDALIVIEQYIKSKVEIDEIDNFIISLLNDSINYINKLIKKRNINEGNCFGIIFDLIEILLSRSKYINAVNSIEYVKVFIKNKFHYSYSLIDLIKSIQTETLQNVDKNFQFLIIKYVVENETNEDFYEILVGDDFEKVIENNPLDFYKYSIQNLKKGKYFFFNMNDFNTYPEANEYLIEKKEIFVKWINISSKYVDDNVVRKDINEFIKSNNELYKKAALSLINNTFYSNSDLFFDSIDLFTNDKYYYADLIKCINNKIPFFKDNVDKLNILISSIEKSPFLNKNTKLKNHIYGIIKKIEPDVNYIVETDKDYVEIDNISRRSKIIDIDRKSRIDDELKNYVGKNFAEAFDIYNEKDGGSFFYNDIIDDAFVRYLKDSYDVNTICSYVNKFSEKLNYSIMLSYSGKDLLTILYAIVTKTKIEKTITNILFHINKCIEDGYVKESFDILEKIDYKKIKLEYKENIVNKSEYVINEPIFIYLQCYFSIVDSYNNVLEKIKEIIDYFISCKESSFYKPILIYFVPMLLAIDEIYGKSILKFCFSSKKGENLISVYVIYSNYSNSNPIVDGYIVNNCNFMEEFKDRNKDGTLQEAYDALFLRVASYHIHIEKQYETLLKMIKEIKGSTFINLLRMINNEQISNTETEEWGRLNSLIEIVQKYNVNNIVDYLIPRTIDLIVDIILSKQLNSMWKILKKITKINSVQITDKLISFIEFYKDAEIKNIKTVVDNLVSNYCQNKCKYDELISIFKDDSKYDIYYKEWLNRITKIDSSFKI